MQYQTHESWKALDLLTFTADPSSFSLTGSIGSQPFQPMMLLFIIRCCSVKTRGSHEMIISSLFEISTYDKPCTDASIPKESYHVHDESHRYDDLAGINYLTYSDLQDAHSFWRAASTREKGKLDKERKRDLFSVDPTGRMGGKSRQKLTDGADGSNQESSTTRTMFTRCRCNPLDYPSSSVASPIFLFSTTRRQLTPRSRLVSFKERRAHWHRRTATHPPCIRCIYTYIYVYMRTWIYHRVVGRAIYSRSRPELFRTVTSPAAARGVNIGTRRADANRRNSLESLLDPPSRLLRDTYSPRYKITLNCNLNLNLLNRHK